MSNSCNTGPWILAPSESQKSALRLFCFPPAGGGAAVYRLWPAALSPDIEVYRIQPPGRETRFREQLLFDIDTYVEQLMDELVPLLDGSFAFFGHSMGSIAAFNVATRLRQSEHPLPSHFIASAFRSPQAAPMKRIFELPQDEFIRELRDTYEGIPDQLLNEPEILSLTLPIVRADLAVVASHTYTPQHPFPFPISVYGGLDDKWLDEEQLNEWSKQTAAKFTLEMFAGNHYYLNPPSDDLFSALRKTLVPNVSR